MKWFRLYDEVLDDPKVQSLRPELFRFWINILCLANRSSTRGTLPAISEIAFKLRVRRDLVQLYVDQLTASRLLVNSETQGLRPYHWDERQRASDNIADRVTAHREKTSGKPPRAKKHKCNVTEMLQSPARAHSDSELREEKKEKETLLLPLDEKKPQDEPEPMPSQAQRSDSDMAQVNEAIRLLAAHADTEPLAMNLSRQHSLPEMIKIEGWKWLVAAKTIASGQIPREKQRSFPYFCGIARNTTSIPEDKKPEPEPVYFTATAADKAYFAEASRRRRERAGM